MSRTENTAPESTTAADFWGDPISVYTRAQAIEDGVLIDVSETAREAGISFPVAITVGLWAEHVVPGEKDAARGQDVAGRLWDVLWMFRMAARRGGGRELLYRVIFVKNGRQRTETIKAICGPGDNMEPVLTLSLPHED